MQLDSRDSGALANFILGQICTASEATSLFSIHPHMLDARHIEICHKFCLPRRTYECIWDICVCWPYVAAYGMVDGRNIEIDLDKWNKHAWLSVMMLFFTFIVIWYHLCECKNKGIDSGFLYLGLIRYLHPSYLQKCMCTCTYQTWRNILQQKAKSKMNICLWGIKNCAMRQKSCNM